MKTKKISILSMIILLGAFLIAGLFIGWIIFGNSRANISVISDSLMSEQASEGETIREWTCSMHPQIRQNEPGDCPICGMDLIPAESSKNELGPRQFEMTEESVKLANIQTSVVEVSNPEKSILMTGKVFSDERRIFNQTAHVAGRIEKLYVSFEGEQVNKGQRLASIYSPDLLTAQKELLEALKIKDSNPDLYKSVRKKLNLWKLSDEQIDDIERSGKAKSDLDIYAGASGVVISKKVNVGDYVSEGGILFELADLSSVWVLFDAYESDLPWIKVGNDVKFTLPSIPGKTFKTKVSFIDPVINSQTRVASVRTEIRNSDYSLKPGMFVNGELLAKLPIRKQAMVVPKSAVMWTGKRSIVYTIVPNTKYPVFEMKEVTLGEELTDYYIILDGLDKGDEVVTNGTFTVDAAAQLLNKPSMMNQNGKSSGSVGHDHGNGKMADSDENNSALESDVQKLELPDSFKSQLNDVLDSYISLKDKLSNDQEVSGIASELTSLLMQVDMNQLEGNAHERWMKVEDDLKRVAQKISNSQGIGEQRKYFISLSNLMISVIEDFGLEEPLYIQFCPMADDNKGAYWISRESKIANPYFGEMMLRCGEVRKEINM